MPEHGKPRRRRPDPERVEPIRDFLTLLRTSRAEGPADGSGDPPTPRDEPGAPAGASTTKNDRPRRNAWGDYVDYGVRLGYDVVEEQIRQGKRVAERFNGRRYEVGDMSNDLQDAVQRFWRYNTEIATLWFDMAARIAGRGFQSGPPGAPRGGSGRDAGSRYDDFPEAGGAERSWDRPRDPAGQGLHRDERAADPYDAYGAGYGEPAWWEGEEHARDRALDDEEPGDLPRAGEDGDAPPRAPEPGRMRLSVSVDARQETEVSIDLLPGALGIPLATHGLLATDPDVPPLDSVVFHPGANGALPKLVIRVPDDCAEGMYTGAVFDPATGQPQGWVSIRVTPA